MFILADQQGNLERKAQKPSSYIDASFVKFVEGVGAYVVPILTSMTKKQIMKRLNAGAFNNYLLALIAFVLMHTCVYSHGGSCSW